MPAFYRMINQPGETAFPLRQFIYADYLQSHWLPYSNSSTRYVESYLVNESKDSSHDESFLSDTRY